MYEDNRGQQFLKTTGILMLLCAGVSLVFTALGLLGIGFLDANISTATTLLERLLVVSMIATCVSSLVWIAGGILGILFCENDEKAYICLLFGCLAVFFTLACVALAICSRGMTWLNLSGLVIGLLLTGYYTYGSVLNFKKCEKSAEAKENHRALKAEKKRNKKALKEIKQNEKKATA